MDGVGVGLLRILGVGVGIFDPTPTPKVQFNYFSTCFACLFLPTAKSNSIIFQHALPVYFYLLHKQAVHGLFDHETWEGVAIAFRLFFSEFLLFCQKVYFFTL